MAEAINRSDLERALWKYTEWRIDQSDVDQILELSDVARLLDMADEHAAARVVEAPGHVCSVASLPDAVKAEIEAAREEAYASGLEVGYTRGVAECVRRAAERPREPVTPWGTAAAPGSVYQRSDGGVWQFLGFPVSEAPVVARVPEQRQAVPDVLMASKSCTRCRRTKAKTAFSKDPKAAGGIRGRCKECESEIKAERKRRNVAAVPA